jgi:membrane protease YdiL (CAAX protease family)
MGAALFALAALGGGTALYLLGTNPLTLIHTPLPVPPVQKALFFIVGGCIAPIAEEVLFRGYLYTYCRRWGILAALALSTAVFVALHLPSGLPVTQLVGGMVFALAYEYSGSLIAPILIHSLGNLAIFSLSLI